MKPNRKGTIRLTATVTQQTVALPNGGGLLALFTNTGPDVAFVEVGDSTVLVTAPTSNSVGGGAPIIANQPTPFTLSPGDTHVAIVSTGNSTVYLTLGKETL